jgi:GNAT superfamily N-acetyltransferase
VRVACIDDRIVGIDRTVDGGNYYGMVVDLIVDPEFQGWGIGSEILSHLGSDMNGFYNVHGHTQFISLNLQGSSAKLKSLGDEMLIVYLG